MKNKVIKITSRETENKILRFLERKKYKWKDGEKPTEYKPNILPYILFIDSDLRWTIEPEEEYITDSEFIMKHNKKIIVNNKEEELLVLRKLQKKGYVWYEGQKPTKYFPLENDASFPYVLRIEDFKITFEYIKKDTETSIEASEYLKKKEKTNDKKENEKED